jgi:hypothetical protein
MHPDIAVAIAWERTAALRKEADLERLARSASSPDTRRRAWRYTPLGMMRLWHWLRRAPVIGSAGCPSG